MFVHAVALQERSRSVVPADSAVTHEKRSVFAGNEL
jgi:hypothetical protein